MLVLAMGVGGTMRRAGTHCWQAPTALDLPPGGGGGAQLKRHPPTHRLTNTRENMRGKLSSTMNVALPLKTTNQLLAPRPQAGHKALHTCTSLPRGGGGSINRRHPPF